MLDDFTQGSLHALYLLCNTNTVVLQELARQWSEDDVHVNGTCGSKLTLRDDRGLWDRMKVRRFVNAMFTKFKDDIASMPSHRINLAGTTVIVTQAKLDELKELLNREPSAVCVSDAKKGCPEEDDAKCNPSKWKLLKSCEDCRFFSHDDGGVFAMSHHSCHSGGPRPHINVDLANDRLAMNRYTQITRIAHNKWHTKTECGNSVTLSTEAALWLATRYDLSIAVQGRDILQVWPETARSYRINEGVA